MLVLIMANYVSILKKRLKKNFFNIINYYEFVKTGN